MGFRCAVKNAKKALGKSKKKGSGFTGAKKKVLAFDKDEDEPNPFAKFKKEK